MSRLKELHDQAKLLVPEEDWEEQISSFKEAINEYIQESDITPKQAYGDIRAIITNECRIRIMFTAAAAYEIQQEKNS